MTPPRHLVSATILAALALASPALAQQQQRPAQQPQQAAPQELGRFGTWIAYRFAAQGAVQCYVLGAPQRSEPRDIQPGSARRDPTNLFITNRPAQNVRNEISIMIGYAFRPNAAATVEVVSQGNTRRFTLVTRDRGAWLQNAAEEQNFVQALRGGRDLRVRGTSQRGTATVDHYSLQGIAGALDRIAQCR